MNLPEEPKKLSRGLMTTNSKESVYLSVWTILPADPPCPDQTPALVPTRALDPGVATVGVGASDLARTAGTSALSAKISAIGPQIAPRGTALV